MDFNKLCKHIDNHNLNICIRKKGLGPILLELLLPFVIPHGFCLCMDSAYAGKSTCTTACAETI